MHVYACTMHLQVAWDVIWNGDRATTLLGVSSKACPITAALVRAAFHDAGTHNACVSAAKKGLPCRGGLGAHAAL